MPAHDRFRDPTAAPADRQALQDAAAERYWRGIRAGYCERGARPEASLGRSLRRDALGGAPFLLQHRAASGIAFVDDLERVDRSVRKWRTRRAARTRPRPLAHDRNRLARTARSFGASPARRRRDTRSRAYARRGSPCGWRRSRARPRRSARRGRRSMRRVRPDCASPAAARSRILASALRAAADSSPSPRFATQREPSTIASISVSENISGGSRNPGFRMYPTPLLLDFGALALQRRDVAIERAKTDAEFLSELGAADGARWRWRISISDSRRSARDISDRGPGRGARRRRQTREEQSASRSAFGRRTFHRGYGSVRSSGLAIAIAGARSRWVRSAAAAAGGSRSRMAAAMGDARAPRLPGLSG